MHAIQQSSWDRDWLQQWRRETETYITLCCRFSACLDDVISVVTWHGATTRCDVIIDVLTSTSAAAVSATTRCRLSTEQPSGNSRSPVSATHTYCRAGSDNAQIFSARSVSARWCTRVRFRALQFARRNVYLVHRRAKTLRAENIGGLSASNPTHTLLLQLNIAISVKQ